MRIEGIVKKGYGLASYTINKQKPFFKEKIPSIDRIRTGTINLDVSPKSINVKSFDFFFQDVFWDKKFPIEDFGLICIKEIIVNGSIYKNPGFLYFPNKSPHVSNLSQIEIIAEPIKEICYGAKVFVEIDDSVINAV